MATLAPDSQLPRLAPGPAERGRRLRPSPSADSGTAWCQGTAGRAPSLRPPGAGQWRGAHGGSVPTAPQPTLVERRERLAETLRGTSGSDSLALSMLMWVRQLLSVRWIPLLGGDSPEEQRRARVLPAETACPTRGAPTAPLPAAQACHRLSGPGGAIVLEAWSCVRASLPEGGAGDAVPSSAVPPCGHSWSLRRLPPPRLPDSHCPGGGNSGPDLEEQVRSWLLARHL